MKEHIASSSSTSSFTARVSKLFFRKEHNHYCGPLRGLHL